MEKVLKIIYTGFLTLFFVLISLLLATGVYIYHYQEQIIKKAFQAATSAFNYPIKVKHIELSLVKGFPKLTLLLHQVTIQDPAQDSRNILVANSVDCVFDIIRLIRRQYILEELYIKQGILAFTSQKQLTYKGLSVKGKNNIQQPHLSLPINLKKLVLDDVQCLYTGKLPSEQYTIYAKQLQTKFNSKRQDLSMHLVGQVVIQQIASQSISYISDIPIHINTDINYDPSKQVYNLYSSGSIKQNESNNIHLQGAWSANTSNPFIDLQITVPRLAISNVLPFLPTAYRNYLMTYQLQGKFACKIELSQREETTIHADFQLHEGSLLPKNFIQSIDITTLVGKVDIPNVYALNTGTLEVNEYVIKLGKSQLAGSIKLSDLKKLRLHNYNKVVLDLPTLMHALSPASTRHATGQLVGYWELDTNLYDLLLKPVATQKLSAFSGQLNAEGVQFMYNRNLIQLQDNLTLLLENDGLHVKDLAGHVEGKTFVLTGTLSNWYAFLLNNNRKNLFFNAKLYADYLALDKLFLTDSKHKSPSIDWLSLTSYLVGELVCDMEEVVYKRFRGNKIRGKLTIKDEQLVVDSVELMFAGGKTSLTTTIHTKSDSLEIHTQASLQNVQLATLFYTFGNFNQNFLEDKHLGGYICSDIDFGIQADKHFRIDENSLSATMSIQLHNGVLKNFEPMQRLSPYVAAKELKYLRFSSLKNNIHIGKKTIYIPPMEVHTSVTSIQLSGTHTFDGKIAYNLVIPLQNANSKEIRRQIPEINEEALAGLNLYLKLEGTTEDYTLRYNNALFRLNLEKSLKNQGVMLGEILQGRGGASKSIKELSTDEYFDFG